MKKCIIGAGAAIALVLVTLGIPIASASASIDGYKVETVSATFASLPGEPQGASAYCGSGYNVLGGGFRQEPVLVFPDSLFPDMQILVNRPIDNPNPEWRFTAINSSPHPVTIHLYATCALE